MQTFRARVFRAIIIVAVVAITVQRAFADDPPSPFDPPDARVKPPIGAEARVKPPIGVTSEPSFFKLLLEWFAARSIL